ncbi:hypothetical protein [Acinetobacter pittii]|nr:hypothetical protein [Acinetobacter pittii]
MLTEIAIADAYGAGFEFCSQDKIISQNKLELRGGPTCLNN